LSISSSCTTWHIVMKNTLNSWKMSLSLICGMGDVGRGLPCGGRE
jgi:hypothetical protein